MSTHMINKLRMKQSWYRSLLKPSFVCMLLLTTCMAVSFSHVTSVLAAAGHANIMQRSANWSGYVATSGGYQQASMTWTVPCIDTANPQGIGQISMWVGIGGANENSNLVQAGTMSSISKNSHFSLVKYWAWVENLGGSFFQALPQTVFEVNCGDQMSSQITGNTMTISDLTSHMSALCIF